jgi:hypothetical protein
MRAFLKALTSSAEAAVHPAPAAAMATPAHRKVRLVEAI